MTKILVIVESPAKCNKIADILNSFNKNIKYVVKASVGHIRDLPSNKFAININDDYTTFIPDYEIMDDKIDVVNNLQSIAKSCDDIILATDLDREGEGIASHLSHVLNLKNPKRIIFSEITKTAIKKAIDNPIQINKEMVEAYETRRLLDRIIGYKLSPVVKKNIENSYDTKISAGRTQSVVLKLICDKEIEITKFESSGYYSISGTFDNELYSNLNNRLKNKDDATEFLNSCKTSIFTVENIKTKTINNKPPIPFITSTLQQDANTKLKFPIAKTQQLAQRLYEQGHITYIRSDCPHISQEFLPNIENYILDKYSNKYLDIKSQSGTKKKKAVESQDAHECIRPTNINFMADELMDNDQSILYDLIWKRTIISQMSNKIISRKSITIDISNVSDYKFITDEDITIFDGYTIMYNLTNDKTVSSLNWIKKGMILNKESITGYEKITQPPSRYNESTIIKDLEKKGIGRPSTYVSSYQTNINRKYIEKKNNPGKKRKCYTLILTKDNKIIQNNKETTTATEKNKLFTTDIGRIVNTFLSENFSDVINYEFTAQMECELDNIANKNNNRDSVLSEFYKTFYPKISKYDTSSTKKEIGSYLDKKIYLLIAKYGPMLQWGEYIPDENKPFCTSISEDQYNNATLDDIIALIKNKSDYPKLLGDYKNKEIKIYKGPYGIYIKYDNKNFNIIGDKSVNLEESIKIINTKLNNEYPKKIGKLKGKTIHLCKGPYSLYLKYNKKNYKVQSKTDITNKQAIKIINK